MTIDDSNGPVSQPVEAVPAVPWDLEGDLARMPLLSILQFLEAGRSTGLLELTANDGKAAHCLLRDGTIVDATFRHLRGKEAVLGILGVRSGRFGFAVREVAIGTTRLQVSPILMELVRLEDELERVAVAFPCDAIPLALRNPHEVPTDSLECGADTVMASIAARPHVLFADLERSLPFAPIKVRLAVAWLAFTNRLRSAMSMTSMRSIPSTPDPNDWYANLLLRFPGGMRVVYGTSPMDGPHTTIAAITALAKALDSGPAWMSVAPDGTSMARVRPRAGGLLSLASFPVSAENTEAFRRFAGTAAFVILCKNAPKDLLDTWSSLCPDHVPKSNLLCKRDGSSACIVNAFQRFARLIGGASTALEDSPELGSQGCKGCAC